MDIDAYIFGGTFDPPHQGHLGVVRELLAPQRLIVIAPTAQNPLKGYAPTPVELRREMIRLVAADENLDLSDRPSESGIYLSDFDYVYAADFVRHWRERFGGSLHWVVGPDIAEQTKEWKDWNEVGVPIYVAANYADNLRATDVRSGRVALHPALEEFAGRLGVYGR